MSLVKQSQILNLDGVRVKPEELPKFMNNDIGDIRLEPEDQDELSLNGGNDEGEVTIEVEDVDPAHNEFAFTLPKVPGGDNQDEIEEPTEIEVEEPEEIEVIHDPWKWNVHNFLPWLQEKMNGVPRHSGRDTAGLERACAYLEALDREISRAVRMDLDNKLAIDAVEKARDEIHKGIERLQERLDKVKATKYPGKKKKKADDESSSEGLVKEAQKTTHIGGIMITVPLLISSLARSCINGMVSAGHDIENIFVKLAKEYDLTKREKLELIQLLSDMNYPVRRDLGMPLEGDIDTTSSDNVNWAANYPA